MKRAKRAWLVLPFLAVVWALASRAQGVPSLADFVLFASDSLKAKGLKVLTTSGDLGANNTFKSTRPVFAPNSTIAASTVVLDPASQCDDLLAHQALTGPFCGPAQPVTTPIVANLAQACGAPSPFPPCGGQTIIVGHRGATTLAPGAGGTATFGDVKVYGGGHGAGTLSLQAGTYTFCSLSLARNANLIALGPVQINVVGAIKFDTGSFVGPGSSAVTPCQVRIFSNGQNVRISRRGAVRGILCAPNALMKITTGAKLEGGFYAKNIDSDRIQLSAPGCSVTTTTTTPSTTSTTRTTTTTTTTATTATGSSSTSTSTTTSTTTPTTQPCGNGVVDPGEACDPSSPAGALLCPPGQICTQECTCVTTTTATTSSTTESTSTTTSTTGSTSTESSSTSTSTTSTTTPTTQPCGNGVVDPGEPCDPSSPAGALLCPAGEVCTQECVCATTTTASSSTTTESTSTSTSTTGESTTSTSSTTTTSTTGATTSSTTVASTTTTTVTTSTTTTTVTTSTTTTTVTTSSTTTVTTSTTTTTTTTSTTTTTVTTSSTTTTVTTTSTTSTTAGQAPPSFMDFTNAIPSGVCGHTYRTTDGTGPVLKNLACGGLDIGGGQSTVAEGPTPDGTTVRFALSCNGSSCTLAPTLADGPTFKCSNTGCVFGTPLPIVNGTLSTCVQNIFSSPGSGSLDLATGASAVNIPLTSVTIVTGNATQPCPLCRIGTITGAACSGSPASPCTGVCEGSPNQPGVCVSTNSQGLTNDCPLPAGGPAGNKCYKGPNNGGACTSNAGCGVGGVCSIFVGNIPVNLSPLTSGTAELAATNGLFCTQKRCLGGTNYGLTCNVDTDCPGTTAIPRCVGQGTSQVGAFLTNVCLAGANSGLPCTVANQAVDCPGSTCRVGTGNNMCNGGANDGKGCTTATDCGGSPCVKAGTLARLIRETGTPPATLLPFGTPHSATLASVFCIPAASTDPNGTGQGFLINGSANLPGPGATTLPGFVTLIP